MKKYIYKGTEPLTFTFEDKDYVVYEEGPHLLPNTAPSVKSFVKQGLLIEKVQPEKPVKI